MSMLDIRVQDTDKGYKKFLKRLKNEIIVDVGYFAGSFFGEDGVDLALKAWQNEFGSNNIPERSFMRSTIDENKKQIKKFVAMQEKEYAMGKLSWNQANEKSALFVIGLIKKKITSAKSWAVANAPSTIAQKGSSAPLVDTGEMRNKIDWKEVK